VCVCVCCVCVCVRVFVCVCVCVCVCVYMYAHTHIYNIAGTAVSQRCALRQHSCKTLCPVWSDVIVAGIEPFA